MDSWLMKNEKVYLSEDGKEIMLTLFVGAIGSEATEESLTAYFEGFGKVAKVKIIVDWVTKQSKECALVYFTSQDSIRKVLAFPKHIIDGRLVRVEPADRTKKGTKVIETPTLLVTNINYLTLHGEIIEYFSRFGQITSCKFFKDRKSGGSRTKSAIIRFEKQHSLEKIFSTGKKHVVGGNEVCCSIMNNNTPEPEGDYDYEKNNEYQPQYDPASRSTPFEESADQFDYKFSFRHLESYKPQTPHLGFQESSYNDTYTDYRPNEPSQPNLHQILPEPNPQKPITVSDIVKAGNRPDNTPKPKPSNLLFPLEHQKDELFQVFCNFDKPPPEPMIKWEDTPYSKMPQKRKKKN